MIVTKDDPLAGCGHADETIETIHSGCGAALALTPLDMDPGKLARVVLEPFEPVIIGIGCLKQHKTDDLRALVEVLLEVYRDGDGGPVDQGGIPAGGLPPVFGQGAPEGPVRGRRVRLLADTARTFCGHVRLDVRDVSA